jgi:gamma-glutamyltranspeptidase/glutathione hydrolase
VAESPLTGPGAGGFALVLPGDGRAPRVADFFVSTPGLGRPVPPDAEMHAIDVGFGGDSETTQVFRIGEASCAVPGAAAGLESVHAIYGRLPWKALLQPAIELARAGIEVTREQAHLHAILDLILRHADEGRRIYSRADGTRMVPGDTLRLDDLGRTLEQLAEEGAAALYHGDLATAIVRTVGDGGGITKEDLAAYRVAWRRPVRARFRGYEVVSNPPPSSGGILIAYGLSLLERVSRGGPGSAEAIASLAEVMREQTRVRDGSFTTALHRGGLARRLFSEEGIAAGVARIKASAPGVPEPAPAGTTHVSAVDAAGNAASLSSSTGSGSGVIVPGTGIHLNNMLGEYDLVAGGPATPGRRLTSMMAPTVIVGDDGPRLVVGSAGSVRLRGAIMQVIANVVEHGLGVADAIDLPRVHVDEPHVHCEGGFDEAELARVEAAGYDVIRWRRRNLFFGGTNAVEVLPGGTLAAAGDARRGGAGAVVE